MSDFDTRVMRWLAVANINGVEKKNVLSNGIGGADRYVRLESDGSFDGGAVDFRSVVDWRCREAMIREVQKVDNDLDTDPEFTYSEKLTGIQALLNTLGPNSCGVAWLRHDGTLRLQLAVKKLPFRMVNNMPSPDLPVRVLGLIKLGIMILEYKPTAFGYEAMKNHVSPIKKGGSVPCPLFKRWPHPLKDYRKKEIQKSESAQVKAPYHNLREATQSPPDDVLMRSVGDGRWNKSASPKESPPKERTSSPSSTRRNSYFLLDSAASIPRSPTYDPIYGESSIFESPKSPKSPKSPISPKSGSSLNGTRSAFNASSVFGNSSKIRSPLDSSISKRSDRGGEHSPRRSPRRLRLEESSGTGLSRPPLAYSPGNRPPTSPGSGGVSPRSPICFGSASNPRIRHNYPPEMDGGGIRRGNPSKPPLTSEKRGSPIRPPSPGKRGWEVSSSSIPKPSHSHLGTSSHSFMADSSTSSIPRAYYNYKDITAREYAQYGAISMATMFTASDSTLPVPKSPPVENEFHSSKISCISPE
eukprot:TRINITY_DN2796_c0_g2_i1.p1 TRINITY_DN2796_c0_g2~~TRINITY_DN2796_c0_g2_i1.p1  ORF type:complete len:528 (+),score=51.11 TRINITY_DN2796_c0_g2_i1:146-1729(+)